MADWSPTQMLRQIGPEEWALLDPGPAGRIGLVRRIEVGPFRETWFRAVTWAKDPDQRALVGYSHDMESAAKALWGRRRAQGATG
jgi:hypothetical protein